MSHHSQSSKCKGTRSWRAVGSPHWLHTVSTQFRTWYFAHRRRGCEAMDAVSKNGLTALAPLRLVYQGTPFQPTPDNP